MDEIAKNHPGATEFGGFGLTKLAGIKTQEITDFIYPRPTNILRLGFVREISQAQLAQQATSTPDLRLVLIDGSPFIVSQSHDIQQQIANISPETGTLYWQHSSAMKQLLALPVLPSTIRDLEKLIAEAQQREQLRRVQSNAGLALKTDWDFILWGTAGEFTSFFMENLSARAKATQTKIGFSSHHHPSFGHAMHLFEDRSLPEMEGVYNTLLGASGGDIETMQRLGVDFFETRVFGTPQHPFDTSKGISSRLYRTASLTKMSTPI